MTTVLFDNEVLSHRGTIFF